MADGSWSGLGYGGWSNLDAVRERVEAGADPQEEIRYQGRPLNLAAERGSPDVVAYLAGAVDDVDTEDDGRTALWLAVHANRPDNARALAAAGANPYPPMMNGWSPARLSLASAIPDLFPTRPGIALSDEEQNEVARAGGLLAATADVMDDGYSACCVRGIDAAEAVRRLGAERLPNVDWAQEFADEQPSLSLVGVTDVGNGCIVSQPWAYACSLYVGEALSAGTVAYAMYANPKSGNQGSSYSDGTETGGDLSPGAEWSSPDDPPLEILRSYLYRTSALAYCCAYAGLELDDGRAFGDQPDMWVRLPAELVADG